MTRTFSLGLVVALLLALAIAEASRGRANQTDGQKAQSRGSTRFYLQSTTESDNFPSSSTEASKPHRDKNIRLESVPDLKKHESHVTRENPIGSRSKPKSSKTTGGLADTTPRNTNTRHSNSDLGNSRTRSKSHTTQVPKEEVAKGRRNGNEESAVELPMPKRQTASRRMSSEAAPSVLENSRKLDLEVFTKSPNRSRSRTGRKVYTNYNEKDLNDQTTRSRKLPVQITKDIKSSSDGSEKQEAKSQSEHYRKFAETTENIALKENAHVTHSSARKMDASPNNSSDQNNSNERIKERDLPLSGSESIRVDIPLTDIQDNLNAVSNFSTSTTTSSINVSPRQVARAVKEKLDNNDIARSNAKKSRQSDRSKSRGRSKSVKNRDFEAANPENTSRKRGSSTATIAETNGRSSNNRGRSNTKSVNSRSRSAQKSRDVAAEARSSGGRGRNADTDLGGNANAQTEARRSSSNDRRTPEVKRRSSDSRSARFTETRMEERDVRAQPRIRSRVVNSQDITTAYIPKATIAETTTASSAAAEVTTPNSASSITRTPAAIRTSTTDRASRSKVRDRGESARLKKLPKEDFFNHGLGFRGRKSSTDGPSSTVADLKTTTPKSETQLRGNPGWTLRRRPSHVNHDISSTTSAPINRDQANEVISPTDSPRSTSETPLGNAKSGRRGTKRPKVKDESNTVSGITAKSVTRGSKTFDKSKSFDLPSRAQQEESDNYPPAFRARLSQLKNSNLKPTGAKSLTRTSSQATKPSSALFSERSKLKLDLARRLIKPELNVDENNFDVTTSPYSGKSKAKEPSAGSESRSTEKTTRATKTSGSRVAQGSPTNESTRKEKPGVRGRWKIAAIPRKLPKNPNLGASSESPVTKKSRMTFKGTVTPSFIERTSKSIVELNAIPREITVSYRGTTSLEETAATTLVDATKIRSPTSRTTTIPREETLIIDILDSIDENIIVTTEPVEPTKLNKTLVETTTNPDQVRDVYDAQKESTIAAPSVTSTTDTFTESTGFLTTEFAQEITLSSAITTPSDSDLSTVITTTTPKKLYPVYIPNSRNDGSQDTSSTTKNNFRPRYTKPELDKVAVSMVTSRTVGPTSRYIRKKSGVFTQFDSVPKIVSTEATLTQTKRREFRPRTATYRRHSEMPTSSLVQPTVTKEETTSSVTITPKPTKFHASVKSSTPTTRLVPTEPFVSVRIDSSSDSTPRLVGITDSSNGISGSNIFNPTRSAFLGGNTTTLLEQLRSTVAPLLNTLGNKTPIFSGSYSNVDTNGNSPPRITPNGAPPRFSARYKGAELLVRKPAIDQAVVPSITTSSTTASTPLENSSSASPVYVVSPGEPRFVTFYQALESASIKNENLRADDGSQQRLMGGLTKVDSNATVPNAAGNDTANNDTASPTTTTASIATTPSSESTVDTTTTTQSADITLASRLNTENSSEAASTTAPTPANPDPNEVTTPSSSDDQTTPAPTSESIGITTPDNSITNISSTPEPFTTTESIGVDSSTSVDVTSTERLPATESTLDKNARLVESSNTSTKSTQATSSTAQTENAPTTTMTISTTPQTSSGASDPSIPSTTVTSALETTTFTSLNDASESIETNTIQQSEETTSRPTDVPIDNVETNIIQQSDAIMSTTIVSKDAEIENIETNTIQQSDVTTSQTTEGTSTTEQVTTEEISNDVIETRTTQAPITSTFRGRLIDFAQDILSRLQVNLTSNTTPGTTLGSSTRSGQGTVPAEAAQLSTTDFETTTSSLVNTETTTGRNTDIVDADSARTTIDATNGPREMTTEDRVGLDTASSSDKRGNESIQSESTTVTQDPRSLENSSGDTTVIAIVTSTPISRDFTTNSGSQSSNDTLLTELMTIAKNLFSEAMNDTRYVPNQTSDVQGIQVNATIGNNERDGLVSSSDTLVTIPASSRPTMADAAPELTTNPTRSSNSIEQQTTPIGSPAQQDQFTTAPSSDVESLNLTTNNPFTTDPVTNNTDRLLAESTAAGMLNSGLTELTTNVAATEASVTQANAVDTTNQTPEPTTIEPAVDLQAISDQSPVANASEVFGDNATGTTGTSDIQAFSTEPSTEAARNLVNSTDTTTNQSNDVTTNAPTQTLTDLVSESPNLIARFQDTMATTAQGTADSGIIQPEQTTETTIPTMTTPSAAPMPINPTMLPKSSITSTSVEPTVTTTTEPTVATTMTIATSTSTATIQTTSEPMSETTTSSTNINENLVSTEASTTQGTIIPNEVDDLNMISRMDTDQATTTSMTSTATSTTTTPTTTTTITSTAPAATSAPTTSTTPFNAQTVSFGQGMRPTGPTFAPVGPFNTIPYLRRYGGSPMTPAPRLSSSSKAPVRDYLIYGIYPNKTIVRKRPEDNLIDPRNVDSPYVIFGIYPDGRLVRKFPNGTIIPDSPRNPVEVVFSLSTTTTTTNRPAPRPYYNQANNQYQAPVYYNNRRPVDELTRIAQSPGPVDIGLTANAIGVPLGGGPYFTGPFGTPASIPGANKMSDILLNTQMGTLPNAALTIGNLQVPITNSVQTQDPVGPIVQDYDRSEASRTRVTSDQRSSVYIGQDKFINYQIDGAPVVNPKVVDVKINSVATSMSEGTASTLSSSPSFDNLLGNQQSGGVITASPGFPWSDPLDQIFGITTNSPIRTASVASNQLDESENNVVRPVSSFVEVFTPTVGSVSLTNPGGKVVAASTSSATSTTTATTTPTTATTTTAATPIPTTAATTTSIKATTTTPATSSSSTTTTTTTTPTTVATTTAAVTTTTTTTTIKTTTTSTTPATITTGRTTTTITTTPTIPRFTTTAPVTATAVTAQVAPSVTKNLNAITSSPLLPRSTGNILNGLQDNAKENPFGTTFGDLAFLNSLLQNNNFKTTTPKTLSEVEQMLANRILALALGKPGPARSPKAVQSPGLNDNSISNRPSSSPSEPIIIDLLPHSSTSNLASTTKRYTDASTTASARSTIPFTTTKPPVIITAKPKTTARPKTTTQAPGFGVSLWRALFGGGNLFETTTASTTKNSKQKSTTKAVTPKPVQTTQKPVTIQTLGTIQKPTQLIPVISHIMSATPIKSPTTPRSVDISDIQVSSTKLLSNNINSASSSTPSSTPSSISTTQQTLLNNPNPRLNGISTSTYSPEDDAKFLVALLRAIQTESKTSTSATPKGITEDDEAFLRAILSNQAITTTTAAPTSTEVNPAALLALLLKQQGIEPSTPATNLREQLQLASLGLNTQSQSNPTTISTTPRPMIVTDRSPSISSTPRTVSTTKKVTPKPTSRPKLQTTTWAPSSTYPPPLFSSFSTGGSNSGSGLATATRVFGQFLGAAISGAAQQLQSLIRNGTRSVTG